MSFEGRRLLLIITHSCSHLVFHSNTDIIILLHHFVAELFPRCHLQINVEWINNGTIRHYSTCRSIAYQHTIICTFDTIGMRSHLSLSIFYNHIRPKGTSGVRCFNITPITGRRVRMMDWHVRIGF